MAVVDAVPGLTVTIRVDGQTATEYDAEPMASLPKWEGVPSVHKYIESKTGAPFSVILSVTNKDEIKKLVEDPLAHLLFEICVDGRSLGTWRWESLTRSGFPHEMAQTCYSAETKDRGIKEKRLFFFQAIKITSEDACRENLAEQIVAASQIGVIHVGITVGRRAALARPRYLTHKDVQEGPHELSEKSLKGKALFHGSGSLFGGQFAKSLKYDHTRNRKKLASYYFYYRSADALKQELVLPGSPVLEPTTAPTRDVLDGMSQEDIRRLARVALANTVKDEKPQGVKRELSPSGSQGRVQYKVAKLSHGGEEIDLTED